MRTVLDIGCGEGQWQPILKRLRPRQSRYLGVDPSEYAVGRYGKQRNLKLGGFADLGGINLTKTYDLHLVQRHAVFVPRKELNVGLSLIAQMLGGIAFLEAYASEEALEGDFKRSIRGTPRSPAAVSAAWVMVSCGRTHCYCGSGAEGTGYGSGAEAGYRYPHPPRNSPSFFRRPGCAVERRVKLPRGR